MKSSFFTKAGQGSLLALFALSTPVFAGESAKEPVPVESSSIWEKPIWLTDLGLGVHESYDSNVYASGAGSEYYPKTLPEGDIATKDKGSLVTTISPKIGADFAKLLGSDNVLKVFSLGYAPDFVIFHDAPRESYSSQRFTTVIQGKSDPVSFSLDNAFTYIDGSNEGLIYPAGYSSFRNNAIRERLGQWQERTKASVKVDLGPVFIRPTASLLYYDLATAFKNISTYSNYVDRYDLNGGTDFGYNVTKDVAFTLGYRYGHQYQQALPFDVTQTSSTNDYQRVLFGVEGSPLKWLKVEGVVGPQFTTYTDQRPFQAVAVGKATELVDKNSDDVYAEATVTIAPTKSDALVFKYKRWNWVSSTGKNTYIDTSYDTSFRHQITQSLQLQLGFRVSQSDYNPSSLRNDWLYTSSVGLRYTLTKNVLLDVAYSYDQASNGQDLGVAIPSTREFERSIVSTGVQWSF
jgi:opacity protein-like surface antigen